MPHSIERKTMPFFTKTKTVEVTEFQSGTTEIGPCGLEMQESMWLDHAHAIHKLEWSFEIHIPRRKKVDSATLRNLAEHCISLADHLDKRNS